MQLKIELDEAVLRSVVESAVHEILSRLEQERGRIAYSESEAAELLGMATHQLRDRRLEGAITAKKIGKSFYYTAETLRRFVSSK